ncbi:hypothetical protein [Leptospira sarikeiensis]|uniref:Uncharacterized protein n=1 Tax=Leptospira sarikeiensis TaxID=2484943 RepID=A0A4R9KEH9_9LEPT|nr:hypothetical protein [Leptospira sarikeiensis]TGL63592.1 hypothetical protein EHQ64_06480 [Leptospira sarikeiensis]
MNSLKIVNIISAILLFVFFLLFTNCNSGGKQDCGRSTPDDKKTSELLQTACLAQPEDPNYCKLYFIEAVYHSHCW